MDADLIRRLLSRTEILRKPVHALSTFGATHTLYHLISPLEDMKDKTRLREGTVLSQKPKILTKESFLERFDGFGEQAAEFGQWINSSYRDLLRALEYNFKNEGLTASVISENPSVVADRIKSDLDKNEIKNQAIISCPDEGWSLALMKFTLDEAARSFPTHVADLERRGLFDPEGHQLKARRREIEGLFQAAKSDRGVLKTLSAKLHEYGLFAEYEDRFLNLFQKP